uniref:ShKT domain-containing protein n=1 Tax=Globodera pallida TaxID=36090 RepID=A0A183CI69_GLOPA
MCSAIVSLNGLLALFGSLTFILAHQKTSRPPCCMDTLSSSVCQRLRHEKRVHFARRCNNDIEFRLIQCCSTCNRFKRSIPYDRIAQSLVRMNCDDRYGASFCKKYVNDQDVWTYKQWSCSGYSPYMAFRACRKTCGFCDFDKVHYNLRNATDACKSIPEDKDRR